MDQEAFLRQQEHDERLRQRRQEHEERLLQMRQEHDDQIRQIRQDAEDRMRQWIFNELTIQQRRNPRQEKDMSVAVATALLAYRSSSRPRRPGSRPGSPDHVPSRVRRLAGPSPSRQIYNDGLGFQGRSRPGCPAGSPYYRSSSRPRRPGSRPGSPDHVPSRVRRRASPSPSRQIYNDDLGFRGRSRPGSPAGSPDYRSSSRPRRPGSRPGSSEYAFEPVTSSPGSPDHVPSRVRRLASPSPSRQIYNDDLGFLRAERKEAERKEAERESLRKEGERRKEAELREVHIKLAQANAVAKSLRKEKDKALSETENARHDNVKALSEAEAKLASERKKIEDRKKELERKEREASKGLRVPPYWKNKTGINFFATNFVRDALQKFMTESSCCPATKQTRVASVQRVENESLWQMYQLGRDILKKNCAAQGIRLLSAATNWQPGMPSKAEMSAEINEFYLFHGTSSKSAHFICEHGFDERVADLNGLYGAGSYFAINSCKSHQYSSQNKDSSTFVVLVCRVAMGSPYCTSTSHNGQRRPPDNAATPGRPFDSIFAQHGIGRGGQQQHNEYVVFDRNQVYPEYIVRYTV